LFGNYSTIDEGYGQNTTNLLNLNNFVHIRKQDLMDANSLKKKYQITLSSKFSLTMQYGLKL